MSIYTQLDSYMDERVHMRRTVLRGRKLGLDVRVALGLELKLELSSPGMETGDSNSVDESDMDGGAGITLHRTTMMWSAWYVYRSSMKAATNVPSFGILRPYWILSNGTSIRSGSAYPVEMESDVFASFASAATCIRIKRVRRRSSAGYNDMFPPLDAISIGTRASST